MKKLVLFSLLLIFIISQTTVLTGCANIVPPSGGPRDSLPPVLLKATPADSSRNFQGDKITFTFDEYVQLDNARANLLMSPLPKTNPDVDYKLKTVTVKFRDSLESNTTYSLNFGNAIKDYNEGNVLKNFTYIFSTGNSLDSLRLRGNVILAETGGIDTTMIVTLYKNGDDSAVVKDKPRYITRLDNKGNFAFHNLPPGVFYLYALRDESGTQRYLEKKYLFAFADKPVTISDTTKSVTLYAYAEAQPNLLLQQLPPGGRKFGATGSDKRLRFQANLQQNKQDLLNDFVFTFDSPLKAFDSSKVFFSQDSSFTPVANYRWEKDSVSKKIRLITSWKENTAYNLILDKDFAEDSSGKKLLKTDTLTFSTMKKEDYGKLAIRFRNLNISVNPVLLFMQGTEIKKSIPLTSENFLQELFIPGDYDLSILYDTNKNGKWDPGEFFGVHKQPEIVKPIASRPKITVKANWENEFEIAL